MGTILDNVQKNNKASLGGIRRSIYYTHVDWLTAEPKRYANPTTAKQNTHLFGAFQMAGDKTFKKISCIFEKNSLDVQALGEKGISSAWQAMPKFKVINNSDEAYSFAIEANKPSGEFVFAIPLNDGRLMIIGEKELPCMKSKVTGNFPEKLEEGSILDFEFDYKGLAPLFFEGTIPGHEADFSGDNGVSVG